MGYDENDAASYPERVQIEGDICLSPGGWSLELFTNLLEPLYGREFMERSVQKTAGSFFSAGGGKLIAALDSTPDVRQLLGAGYGLLLDFIAEVAPGAKDEVSRLAAPKYAEEIEMWLSSIDRLNFAVTADPADPSCLRGYVFASTTSSGAMKKAGGIISGAIASYGASDEGSGKILKVSSDGWDSVFSVEIDGLDDLIGGQVSLVAAFGDDCAIVGIMPPSLLEEPFSSGSDLYDSLTGDERVMEISYLDARSLRKSLRSILLKKAPGALERFAAPFIDFKKVGAAQTSAERFAALILMPLIDFRDIGAQTFSPSHFKFTFKTGWPDFEERELASSLMK
jgi:hypothetical protein